MAFGTYFYEGPAYEADLRSNASRWIYAAQSWLSAPFHKAQLNVPSLQVHCLLLLARQTNSMGHDLVWIPAGSLFRTAIHMGLHRDPSELSKYARFAYGYQGETVGHNTGDDSAALIGLCELSFPTHHSPFHHNLGGPFSPPMTSLLTQELSLKSNTDSKDVQGMPPMICIDDDSISESVQSPPPSKSDITYTRTSMQIILFKCLRTRLGAAQVINHFRSKPSYEDILHLSSEVFGLIRESSILWRTYRSSTLGQIPSVFHCNLIEHFLRRSLLALHRPFGIKAPRYFFCRKVCLEQDRIISSLQPDKYFSLLIAVGGGMFKEIMTYGALTICLELITQLEEDDKTMNLDLNRPQTVPMHEAIRSVIALSEERLRKGDTNVRGYLFLLI